MKIVFKQNYSNPCLILSSLGDLSETISQYICSSQPKSFVVENVPNFMRGQHKAAMWGGLSGMTSVIVKLRLSENNTISGNDPIN